MDGDWIEEIRWNRIKEGDEKYGPYPPPPEDTRDFIHEAKMELIDCLTYIEVSRLRGLIKGEDHENLCLHVRYVLNRLREISSPA